MVIGTSRSIATSGYCCDPSTAAAHSAPAGPASGTAMSPAGALSVGALTAGPGAAWTDGATTPMPTTSTAAAAADIARPSALRPVVSLPLVIPAASPRNVFIAPSRQDVTQ